MNDKVENNEAGEKADEIAAQNERVVMWRGDSGMTKPVQVECPDGLYPNYDADGEQIFDNTHFKTEEKAWANIKDCVLAGVSLAGNIVKLREEELIKAREHAGNAAKEYDEYRENWAAR